MQRGKNFVSPVPALLFQELSYLNRRAIKSWNAHPRKYFLRLSKRSIITRNKLFSTCRQLSKSLVKEVIDSEQSFCHNVYNYLLIIFSCKKVFHFVCRCFQRSLLQTCCIRKGLNDFHLFPLSECPIFCNMLNPYGTIIFSTKNKMKKLS